MTNQANTDKQTYERSGSYVNLMKSQSNANWNNVPSIDQITGESVMPSDSPLVPLIPAARQEAIAMKDPNFSQGYLQKHIGQSMRVEFLIGADSTMIDRNGVLMEVGESFIVLQPPDSDDLLMCDLYSIKFVTIFH